MALLTTGLARQSRAPQELQDHSPVPLLVGHIVGPEEIQLVLADDTDVDVAAGAQVVVDAGGDGVSHELLGLLLLAKGKLSLPQGWHSPALCAPELGTIHDTPTINQSPRTAVKLLHWVEFVPLK